MQLLKVFRVGWRYLLRHPWQTGLLVLGITLGVAVMVAIDLANASASRAFDLSTDAITGRATHEIVGNPNGMDETIYTQLRRSGAVEQITPVVLAYFTSPQLGSRPFTLLGVDPFSDGDFRNYLGNRTSVPIEQLTVFLTRPGAMLLSSATAERYRLQVCPDLLNIPEPEDASCQVDINFDGQIKTLYLAGLIDPIDRFSQQALDSLMLVDIATAQEITGRQGLIDRIDLILPSTSDEFLIKDQQQVVEEIKALLPVGVRIQAVAARRGTIEEMTSAFRINLTALSLLALLVGLFLIYNTMTFSVIQRRPLFGTLRCLGTTRQEIFFMVVSEAFLIGVLGSALGVLLGIALGQGSVRLVTQTINDLFFVVNVRGVQIPPESVFKGFLVGTLATLLTAAPPAWEAASVSPRTALYRSGLEDKAQKAVFLVALAGVILITAGTLTLIVIPTRDLVVSFAGTFAVIVGFAMLTPMFTKFSALRSTPILGQIFGTLGRLAPRDISKSISRTSIAIAALMVAVSVTIGVSLMISSFRFTVETWLTQTLQGDIYISAPGLTATQPGGVIDPRVINIISETEGIADFAQLRALSVDSPSGAVNLTGIDHPVRSAELFLAAVGTPDQVWQAMKRGAVIVSEPFANRFNLRGAGGTIQLFTDQGLVDFPVVGIFSDYASTQGTVRMDMETLRQYWNDREVSSLALFLEPDTDVLAVTRELQERLAPIQQVFVRPNLELRQEALSVFDRTFAITGAMRLLATIVAFIGVLSTLLSLQLEKQRQFGILRAVGLTIRQMWGLIFLETGFMGSIAGLLAMPAGYVLSLILIYIINRRSFGWTLQMQINLEPFFVAFAVALTAALLAGIYPAVRMQKMATAEALRGE